jgi:fructose-specific PTS system IIA-like component
MPLEYTFSCPLRNGVHARPASALEEVASCFGSDIVLTNRRTGSSANAKSILAIVAADIRHRDDCRIQVSGTDEQNALAALSKFLRDEFPRCDDSLTAKPSANGCLTLPPMLQNAGATVSHGTPVVKGIGQGSVVQVGGLRIRDSIATNGATDFAAEVRKLDAALAALVANYEERLPNAASRVETEILKAHRSIARDPEFRARLHERLRQANRTAAGAVVDTEAHFARILTNSASALLRERALDLRDVCFQLLRQIYGKAATVADVSLSEPSIVVADLLLPGQFLALERRLLRGLVLGHAGTTSHTVILARSFGIPTLAGVADVASGALQGKEAILDAECGLLVTNLTEPARSYYAMEQRRLDGRRARQQQFASRPATSADGKRIEIAGNISTAAEAAAAFEAGAEAIGLFRTEMLFLDRDEPPSEVEQFEEYCTALAAAGDRPVILRTLDIGGDKPLAYLNLPTEDNPFLGYRAVRIYPEFEPIFRTQVRALVRASAHGKLQVMIPMVTTLEEVRWAKRIIREEQERCESEGLAFNKTMPVGAMIEVPAAVFMMDQLCREVDFFSIGSNDLLQYFAGADRANPRVAKLYDPLQPAFLRLLKKIADDIHKGGKRVGICGEMGGQPRCLPLLVGLGLDEISVAGSAVIALKAELNLWATPTCQELTAKALACGTADEVSRLLDEYASQRPAPLVEPEMIFTESAKTTKEEAIKELVDQLYVLGRTDQPNAIEDAIWRRESVYSTGFGHGFAIPHCKTNAVASNSLMFLKLRQPVQWGSLDDQPVSVLLLLTVRESDQGNGHMKIFSRLARKVMHEDFREQLARETCPKALCTFLNESLQNGG